MTETSQSPDYVRDYQKLPLCFTVAHLKRTGIVVEEIVYDCSSWADEHPGGESVIRSFGRSGLLMAVLVLPPQGHGPVRTGTEDWKDSGSGESISGAQEVFPTTGF